MTTNPSPPAAPRRPAVIAGAAALTYPFTRPQVEALRVGDAVRISGRVFTGRDRLLRHLAEGGACPVALRDGALFHCGPIVLRAGRAWVVRAAGPTTSLRQEPYLPRILHDHGVRVVIGKGGMGPATEAALRREGAVYLQAVGGAAAWIGACVRAVEAVHFLDTFGPAEALWVLNVEDLPAMVTMDAHGGNRHRDVAEASREVLDRLLAETAPMTGPPDRDASGSGAAD